MAISARSHDKLETLSEEINAMGRKALVFSGDMADEEQIKAFIRQTVATFRNIDVLINNAGIGYFYPVTELTTQQWDDMFNLNVRGLFIATREALPHLRQAGESFIVNIASLAGKNSFATGSGYAATKHAVMAFSRCVMLEERQNGVRVLSVCPGSVATNFDDNQPGIIAAPDKALKPSDISSAVLHALQMPQHAMISELDIRPSNPK